MKNKNRNIELRNTSLKIIVAVWISQVEKVEIQSKVDMKNKNKCYIIILNFG